MKISCHILFHALFDQMQLTLIAICFVEEKKKKSIYRNINTHSNAGSSSGGSEGGKMNVVSTLQSDFSTALLAVALQSSNSANITTGM